jgi:uncharacterized damage-inducible protein DinB
MRESFEKWADDVRSLGSLTEAEQNQPIAEGKWAVRDVIAHMWKWDVFFWEHAIRPLTQGAPLTYHHIDYNAFNENAKTECRKLPWSTVVDETWKMREILADAIRRVPEEEYDRVHQDADGHPFSVKAYLEDFLHHDAHHRGQIETVLTGKVF